jgi:quercetin dioxygenase-like cupin family protein
MIVYNNKTKSVNCESGVTRKLLAHDKNQMMTEVTFEKNARGNEHSHPHEQISYIAKGSFEFTLGGKTEVVKQGDSIYIPSNILHSVLALEEAIIVDVFTPMREDFL